MHNGRSSNLFAVFARALRLCEKSSFFHTKPQRFAKHSARIASFCLLLLFAIASPAEKKESDSTFSNLHQWGAVTLFHGLPSNHVRAIAQDGDGVLWFGTDSGLARYDGRRIQKIVSELLPAGRIRALKFDADGALWIGTDAGAARLVAGEFKPIPETTGKAISAILTLGGERAVMASEQGEVFDCYSFGNDRFAVDTITPADSPLLSVDANGRAPLQLTSLALLDNALVVGTRSRGLLTIARTADEPPVVKEILSRPRAFFVEALEADANHQLWFGAQTGSEDSGLYASREPLHPEKVGAGLGTVTALKFDARGDMWVGTDTQGAFRFRDARKLEHFTFASTAGGLRSNRIYAIFIDREGVAWFGTDRGACRYDPHALRVEQISTDPESNFARVMFQSADGALWCGTNRGLFRRDRGSWLQAAEIGSRPVHSIIEDAQGRLLVGTAAGLFIGTKQPGKHPANDEAINARAFTRLDSATATGDNIRAIQVFRGAIYLANFGRGVERLDGTRRALVWPLDAADARERQVISLYAEKDARLWIGTAESGVFSFDGQQATTLPTLDKLRGAAVRAIDGTSDGVLWMATARGLYAHRAGELLTIIDNTDARSIVATSTNLAWCATADGGLRKILLDTDAGPIIARLDTEQGLPSQNVFTVLRAHTSGGNEVVWVGTNRGVARYEPGQIAPLVAPTRVMGKRLFNRDEVRAGLNLEYPQNSLAIDVAAASSRTFPEQFQYWFAVFDSDGHRVRQKLSRDSQLLLENLRAGRYRVEVRAFTNDLVASDPLTFEFAVARAPFPWASTALAMLLLLALVAAWWGYRQNRILAGANRQLADTRLQLANETETERRRIARDLHDQTLADLRRLMMLTDQLPTTGNGHKAVEPSRFRSEIESISTEIRRICEDLSPSVLANVGLAAALEWALSNGVAQLPDEKKFEYDFACDEALEEKLQLAPAVQIQLYRIVQEAVSNICRHSSATQVKLAATIEADGGLLIQLEDNGRGFEPKSRRARKGRGLTNIRSRASLIDADVHWLNQAAGGMLFTLRKTAGRIVG